ncbi:MAG: DsbA family protein [Desertimonas sp.]
MKLPRLLIPGFAVAVAAVVAALTVFGDDDPALVDTGGVAAPTTVTAAGTPAGDRGDGPAEASTTIPAQEPGRSIMAPLRVTNEAMGIGDPDAPLVMVTFESFGCGWCGHFHRLTMPPTIDKWVDTGQLRIESRMMPYEERAMPGAKAGAAAGLQDRYWELAEVMYPYIAGSGDPLFDREPTDEEMAAYHERQSEAQMLAKVESVADEIGLDYDQFLVDYRSPEVDESVRADTQMGYALGFTGTPAMVVNGVPIGGFVNEERLDTILGNVLDASVD